MALPILLSSLALLLSVTTLALGYVKKKNLDRELKALQAASRSGNDAILNLHNKFDQFLKEASGTNQQAQRSGSGVQAGGRSANASHGQKGRNDKFVNWVEYWIKQLNANQESLYKQLTALSGETTAVPRQSAPHAVADPQSVPVSAAISPDEQALAKGYNDASLGDREAFIDRHEIVRIDVANGLELARDPDARPVFKGSDAGEYMAVRLGGLTDEQVAVVPKLGVMYNDDIHQRAGMMHVFDVGSYNPALRYPVVRVVSPAIFRKMGDTGYEAVRRGQLDLGTGE